MNDGILTEEDAAATSSGGQTATIRELADRYEISYYGMTNWIQRQRNLAPVNDQRPYRYRVSEVEAARAAAGLLADRDIPSGMGTVRDLAKIIDRDKSYVARWLGKNDAPQPAGYVRTDGGPVAYYDVEEFVVWYKSSARTGHTPVRVGAEIEELVAPERSPHGREHRYKRLKCGCPVCQSARAAARDRTRGVVDRLPGALHHLTRVLLDPGVDEERAAEMVAALAGAKRIRILRVVASGWPHAVPGPVLRRVLGGDCAAQCEDLVEAGLLARCESVEGDRVVEAFRFVREGEAE